jgi:hypothetical protein
MSEEDEIIYDDSSGIKFVSISLDRLKHLEYLESKIPEMIDEAIKEYKNNNLRKLHEHDKLHPEAINLRVKRYVEKHRDEINAKRREKRRLEKEHKTMEDRSKYLSHITTILENVAPVQSTTFISSAVVSATINTIEKKMPQMPKFSPILTGRTLQEIPDKDDGGHKIMATIKQYCCSVVEDNITVRFDR